MGLFSLRALLALYSLCFSRAERARINSQDAWADALQLSFTLLKSQVEKIHDIDSEITVTLHITRANSFV